MSNLVERLESAIPTEEDIQRCGYLYLEVSPIKKKLKNRKLVEILAERTHTCMNLRKFALTTLALLKELGSNITRDVDGMISDMIRDLEASNQDMLSAERELQSAWDEYKREQEDGGD